MGNPSRSYSLFSGLAVLALLASPLSSAEEDAPAGAIFDQFSLAAGVEYFRWQEFDDSDTRLLTEHGPRLLLAVTGDNLTRDDSGIVYAARLKGYLGTVDYDGQDSGARYVSTDSDYRGWDIRVDGGYRMIDLIAGAAALDLFAGVGVEQWTRDIQNSINALGLPVQGLMEEYTVGYARVGLALAQTNRAPHGYLKLGYRRPFSIDEDVSLDGSSVTLHPGENSSSFVSYKISLHPTGDGRPYGSYMKLYYENYRFGRSDDVVTGNILVWQPRSDYDTFGLMLGFSF